VDDENDDRYARAPEPSDVVRICRALNEAQARYLLIGEFAVIAHGAGRLTKDIDLLIDDAEENVARVKTGGSVGSSGRFPARKRVRAHRPSLRGGCRPSLT
jgi:hypothetical protein